MTYPNGYVERLGPAAPFGSYCACGRLALAECQGCGGTFCPRCWWRHSHQQSPQTPEETRDAHPPAE